MARIGIFPGTFDPVHRGHIVFALAAIKQCRLDKVVFMPERSPRGKLLVSDFKHRLRMVRLALKAHRKLIALQLDDRQFTVEDTLPKLQARYAGAELVMLAGSDVVRTFGFRWPGLERLLSSVQLAIGLRTGQSQHDLQAFLDSLKIPLSAVFIDGPHAHVSATDIRRGGNLQGIEPLVQLYIQEHQLYSTGTANA